MFSTSSNETGERNDCYIPSINACTGLNKYELFIGGAEERGRVGKQGGSEVVERVERGSKGEAGEKREKGEEYLLNIYNYLNTCIYMHLNYISDKGK